jgi:hypothetical protein
MNTLIYSLINGMEIMAEETGKSITETVTLKSPVIVQIIPSQSDTGSVKISLPSLTPLGKMSEIVLNRSAIAYTYEANDQMDKQYRAMHSSIIHPGMMNKVIV